MREASGMFDLFARSSSPGASQLPSQQNVQAAPRLGLGDVVIARKRKRGSVGGTKNPRWVCNGLSSEPNSWTSDYGQMRRNAIGRLAHRLAQLGRVVARLITVKLIDCRNRWSQDLSPIRSGLVGCSSQYG